MLSIWCQYLSISHDKRPIDIKKLFPASLRNLNQPCELEQTHAANTAASKRGNGETASFQVIPPTWIPDGGPKWSEYLFGPSHQEAKHITLNAEPQGVHLGSPECEAAISSWWDKLQHLPFSHLADIVGNYISKASSHWADNVHILLRNDRFQLYIQIKDQWGFAQGLSIAKHGGWKHGRPKLKLEMCSWAHSVLQNATRCYQHIISYILSHMYIYIYDYIISYVYIYDYIISYN